MKKDQPVKRAYRSPSRQAQAARTRARVIEVADELFQAQGFGATSIRQIAEAAEVVPETVYANFGSKAGLLTAIIDVRLAPAGEASVLDRPELAAMSDAPDQRGVLRAFAQDWARMSERARPTSEVLRTAKAVDPAMGAVRDQMEEHRHRYMATIVGLLAERGPLATTVDRAVDVIWALASPDVARMLCDVRGWSSKAYADWLEATLAAGLLAPVRSPR